jgi:hypothetical protein
MYLAWHVRAKFKQVQSDGRDASIHQDEALAALRNAGYHSCVSVEYEGEESGSSAVPRALQYLGGAIAR